MATTNNKCKNCGCEDSFMSSPSPCPTPAGCPTPQPCSEVFDAQCVVYTGSNILCEGDTVVTNNDTVAEALENIVDYFCQPSEYKYINSFFASGDAFIGNTSWHIVPNFAAFNYTAAYTGTYKITLTASCIPEDLGSSVLIGLGVNGANPVGTNSSNPFIIKVFSSAFNVQTHTYIISLNLGDIMQLMFKSATVAVINIDPLYMTIEKVTN